MWLGLEEVVEVVDGEDGGGTARARMSEGGLSFETATRRTCERQFDLFFVCLVV